MEITRLNEILANHKTWLQTAGKQGEKADLRDADLSYTDLRHVDLSYADLRGANLQNAKLQGAKLHNVDLSSADMRDTDLHYTNLSSANLYNANLNNADLYSANLHNADLDFSAAPLWCGSLDIHIDDRQAKQLLYHLVRNVQYSKNTTKAMKKSLLTKTILKKANEFHRIGENNIKEIKEENKE